MPPQLPPQPQPQEPLPAADAGSAGTAGSGHVEDTSGMDVSNWPDPSCRVRRQCRPRLVGLVGCEHVALSDVALADSAFWTLHVRRSRYVELSGLRVSGNRRFPNNDGIDIDGSAHVTIRNCTVSTADDAVCLKTTLGQGERDPDPGLRALEASAAKAAKAAAGCKGQGRSQHNDNRSSSSGSSSSSGDGVGNEACGQALRLPPPRATEHVLVEDCVLRSRSAAVKLGSESRADMANITFRRVQVLDSNRGLGIQLRDWGDVRDVVFEDVSVTTSRVTAGRWWGGGEPIYVTALPRHLDAWGRVGQLRNVSFRRVAATATGGLVVVAGSPESVVRGVTLQDVTLRILPPPPAPHQPPLALAIAAAAAAAAAVPGSPAAVQGPRGALEAAGAEEKAGGNAQGASLLGQAAGVRATTPAAGRRRLLELGTAAAGQQRPDRSAGHDTAAGPASANAAAAAAADGGAQGGRGDGYAGTAVAGEATDWPLAVKLDLRPGPYDVRRWPLSAAGPVLAQYVQGMAMWDVDIQLVAPAPGHGAEGQAGSEDGQPWPAPPPPQRSWVTGWLDWWLARPPPWCVELVARTVHGLQARGVRVRVVLADEASGELPVPDATDAGAPGARGYRPDHSWLHGRGTATGALWLVVPTVMLAVVAITACIGVGLAQWPRRRQARMQPLPTTDSDEGFGLVSLSGGRSMAGAGSSEDIASASVWAAAAAAGGAPVAAAAAPPLPPLQPTGLRSLCLERSRALGSSESLSKKTSATLRTWSPKVMPKESYPTEGV